MTAVKTPLTASSHMIEFEENHWAEIWLRVYDNGMRAVIWRYSDAAYCYQFRLDGPENSFSFYKGNSHSLTTTMDRLDTWPHLKG